MSIDFSALRGEVSYSFVRSGGPGGQNVNKVNTKAVLTWNVLSSGVLHDSQKELVLAQAKKKRLNAEGDYIVTCQRERGQQANKERAFQILVAEVKRILLPKCERLATKPTAASRQKRLQNKKHHSEKKRQRRWRATG